MQLRRFVTALACWLVEVVTGAGPEFDHLRLSVVRIQAVSSSFDWFRPFVPGQDEVGLGSGFVVQTEPYPLFVTNEHVINDAKQVTLQLLIYGEQQWEAQVVSVCSKFDLALLVLRKPLEFQQALKQRNIVLEKLRLAQSVASMGEDVVALGFPLGQDSLKISKGNIAGNEEVDGNICIQSTAPVSPGSSGGPLLNSDGSAVVGVNFAKATEGENINYVIPAFRVQQMISKHLKDQLVGEDNLPTAGSWKRLAVQVPMPELTTIESNEALYMLSEGCSTGVYVSKIGERSFFRNSQPPVSERSFLVSVNGRELDRFGMGLNEEYAADRVFYTDLFFMVEDLNSDVEFETCYQGKITRHNTSLQWKPEYERGLRFVNEPHMLGMAGAYEIFGDISIMEMTVNHISVIVRTRGDPGPARWLHPDLVAKPRLIVNYVRSGSYIGNVIPVGSAVQTINGHKVSTLDEFRKYFMPSMTKIWTLETDMGKVAAVMFNESLKDQVSKATTMNAPYLLTPSVVAAATQLGLISDQGTASSTIGPLSTSPDSRDEGEPRLKVKNNRHPQLAGPGDVKRQLLLSNLHSDIASDTADILGIGGMNIRAAGPLLAERPTLNTGRITRAGVEGMTV